MSEEQLSLFEAKTTYRVEQPKKVMSKDALLKWKSSIFNHQQRTLQTKPPQQTRGKAKIATISAK